MEGPSERVICYCSRVVTGLVACAVLATTVHSDVAAGTLLAATMLVVLTIASLVSRDRRL